MAVPDQTDNEGVEGEVVHLPEAPDSLLNPLAVGKWDSLISLLTHHGLAHQVDLCALERYCAFYGRWVQAEEELTRGLTHVTVNSIGVEVVKPKPEVVIAKDLAAEMLKIERQFGMTPAARNAIASAGQADHNAGARTNQEKKKRAAKLRLIEGGGPGG